MRLRLCSLLLLIGLASSTSVFAQKYEVNPYGGYYWPGNNDGVGGDFRGRSIPNFFGHGTNWPELSAGLTFSWGER